MSANRFAKPVDGRPASNCYAMSCRSVGELVAGSDCPVHGVLLSTWCRHHWAEWNAPFHPDLVCGDELADGRTCPHQLKVGEPISVSGPDAPVFTDVELVP